MFTSSLVFSVFFFLPLFFCFLSQVPKWVYWWSLPKLRNGQLLQYVHFLSVSAWLGACSVVPLSCCRISPQIPARARCVLPGLTLTASACRMWTLTQAIVGPPLFVTSGLWAICRCVRRQCFWNCSWIAVIQHDSISLTQRNDNKGLEKSHFYWENKNRSTGQSIFLIKMTPSLEKEVC